MGQGPSDLNTSGSSRRHNSQPAANMNYQSSFKIPEEERSPPYVPMNGAAEHNEWDDSGVPVWTSSPETQDGSGTQDNMLPQNPFGYDGARPAHATRRRNVILFGETGAGKSSVINLMADEEIAKTSSNLDGCTLEATEYSFTLPEGTPLCIFDTVGLNEPDMGVNTFFGAIEKAYRLITSLHAAGGVDLLLFCIRGGRITSTMQRNYRLFFEFLCGKKVPLAFIVTHLEYEVVMEDWWERNERTFGEYGIQSVAHACITAAPARVTTLAGKRAESRSALQTMLHDALSRPSTPYVQDVRGWFISTVDMIRSFLMRGLPVSFRRRDLLMKLENRCAMSSEEAQQLADMLARG
ncbi:hypothetical protein L210DRAFT_3481214 [Boletus edulis BED1]|uniref:G domain-containing protein n=1 Tax=Boletus edulis BED1 TaxID=1328754 RepID=A0AAD4GDX6_BOLED|nr:hypothetical protein L210DRAFT_3481214 [Boletus edulis BED1]